MFKKGERSREQPKVKSRQLVFLTRNVLSDSWGNAIHRQAGGMYAAPTPR